MKSMNDVILSKEYIISGALTIPANTAIILSKILQKARTLTDFIAVYRAMS